MSTFVKNLFCFTFIVFLLTITNQVVGQSDIISDFETTINLAQKIRQTDPEQAMEYAAQALEFAEEKQDQKLMTQARMMLSSINFDVQNFTKAIEYGKLCEVFYLQSNDVESLASLYNLLTSAYFYIGNTEMSDMYSDKCIELAEKHQFWDVLNRQYYNRGAISFYRGDYSYSMEFAFKALNIAKKTNHPVYTAYCYDLLGNLSENMSKHREAIQYYKLSRKIHLAQDDKKSIGQGYYNSAGAYRNLKQSDSVRFCYYKALEYYKEAESTEGLAIAYTGLSSYYMMEGKLDSAQLFIEEGLKAALQSESKKDLSASYHTAGNISFHLGDYSKALKYYRSALLWARQIGNREAESNIKQSLGQNFAFIGRFDSAYHYLSHSIAIKDSINQLDEVQKRAYAFAENVMKQQHDKEKDAEQLKRRLLLVIAGLCLMVIFILSIFIRSMNIRQKEIKIINDELNKYKIDLEHALQSKTRELVLSEQQILNLSNNLPNGAIFRVSFKNDRELKTLFVSSGWEELTGLPIETIKNSLFAFKSGIHPDDSFETLRALTLAVHNRSMLDVVFRYHRNTDLLWLHVRAMAIAGDDDVTYLDGYLVDETLQKHFEQDLINSRNKAEEADNLKSAFLANISHEVRTPMNAIVGFTSMLSNDKLPPDRLANYIEVIQDNSHRLMQLIEDIVDIAKIETGQVILHPETFRLSKIITAVREHFEPIIENRYQFVKFVIDEDLLDSDLTLHTDFLRLRQIFLNLIENALKFTEKGFVRCGYLLDLPDSVHFFIMDTGTGISQENMEFIFQNFRKVDQYSDGTGLGLPIVKKTLLQMGGDIWVESEPGSGSTFHFTLPIINANSCEIKP